MPEEICISDDRKIRLIGYTTMGMKNRTSNLGFTLIEVLITVVIVSVLASIAIPTYNGHVARGKISKATADLSNLRILQEQFFQNNRRYVTVSGGTTCGTAATTDDNFTYTCAGTNNTFTWTAKNKANAGLGSADDYIYDLDQDGTARTLTFRNTTYGTPKACWLISPSDC